MQRGRAGRDLKKSNVKNKMIKLRSRAERQEYCNEANISSILARSSCDHLLGTFNEDKLNSLLVAVALNYFTETSIILR